MFLLVRELVRRPLRSALSVTGIAVAAAAWIALVAMSRAFLVEVQSTVSFLGTDLTVQQAAVGVPGMSWIERGQLDTLRGMPHVRELLEVVLAVARPEGRGHFFLFGIGPGEVAFPDLEVLAGRMLEPDDDHGLLAGEGAARRLGLEVGEPLVLRGRSFEVVGIFRSDRGVLDLGLVAPLRPVQEAYRYGDRANLAFLGLDDPSLRDEVAAAITGRFPELEVAPSDIWVSTYRQLEIAERFARALALVALLAAALGVSNVLALGVAERAGEIGLLRAVGWSRGRIAWLVLGRAVLLGAAGAVIAWPLADSLLLVLRGAFDTTGLLAARAAWTLRLECAGLTVGAALLGAAPAVVLALRIEPARALRVLA